jgi:hypothetical protein
MCKNYVIQEPYSITYTRNVTSRQIRTSDNLTRLEGGHYQQAFETDAGHCHGTYDPAAPEHTINL